MASSSALTLIETAHPVFGSVRKLWNSPTESHRVVRLGLAFPHAHCLLFLNCRSVQFWQQWQRWLGLTAARTPPSSTLEHLLVSSLSLSLSLSLALVLSRAQMKMSVLESCEDEKSVAAICYLLCVLMPRSAPRPQVFNLSSGGQKLNTLRGGQYAVLVCSVFLVLTLHLTKNFGNQIPNETLHPLLLSLSLSLSPGSLPCEVLQVKYSTTCKILTDQLARHEASSSTALLKSVSLSLSPSLSLTTPPSSSLVQLVKALAMLLGAQPAAVWCGSHCQKVFQSLLNFTIHPKPKVGSERRESSGERVCYLQLRKAAQAAVVAILREGSASDKPHIAATPTATHCRHVLEKGGLLLAISLRHVTSGFSCRLTRSAIVERYIYSVKAVLLMQPDTTKLNTTSVESEATLTAWAF